MATKSWLILMVGITFVVTVLAYFTLKKPGTAPVMAFLFSVVLISWLFGLALLFADDGKEAIFPILTILFGAAVGVVIGALISPWGEQDKGFNDLTKAIGTLATGYVAGKADALIKHVFNPNFMLVEKRIFLFMAFFIALAAAGVATYSARVYSLPPKGSNTGEGG